jgi:hypothetical protein
MRITQDPEAHVAHIRLRARQGDIETLRITSDFLVDIPAAPRAGEDARKTRAGRYPRSSTKSIIRGRQRVRRS